MGKDKEIFLPIRGYEKYYLIGSAGNIKRILTREGNAINKIHKGQLSTRGYRVFDLYNNGKSKSFLVHRLVAMAFIPNPENKEDVNHINGIKTDNRIENLEWCTKRENLIHAFKIGLKSTRGINHPSCNFSEKEVLEIFNSKKSSISLSKKYKVSQSAIEHIKTGNSWSYLTGKKYTPKPRLKKSEILDIFHSKLKYREIGTQYNISNSTIYNIRFGHAHASVTHFKNA